MRSLLEGGFLSSFDGFYDGSTAKIAASPAQFDITAANTPIYDTALAVSVTGRTFSCRYEITMPGSALAATSSQMGVRWSTGTPTGYFSKVRASTQSQGDRCGSSQNRAAMLTLSAGPAYVLDNPYTSSTNQLQQRLHAVMSFASSQTVTLTPLLFSASDTYSIYSRTFDVRVVA